MLADVISGEGSGSGRGAHSTSKTAGSMVVKMKSDFILMKTLLCVLAVGSACESFPDKGEYDRNCGVNSDCVLGYFVNPCVDSDGSRVEWTVSESGWNDYRDDFESFPCISSTKPVADGFRATASYRPECSEAGECEIVYYENRPIVRECARSVEWGEWACRGRDN